MYKEFSKSLRDAGKSLLIPLMAVFLYAVPAKASVSSIMIDANSGEILASSAADTLRYPASLTKVMTLYITFDAIEKGLIKFDDLLPVSRTAANRSPSKLGLRPGEKISVRDAVMAVIVKSANDCATVLAEGLGYSEANFAKTMTKVAHELGMKNTTFKNASGLPNKAQKTTARDMALLGAAMYHHFPQYYKLFATKKFTYKGKTIYTHNHLLKTFEGADGMKTGYTAASGYNIMTSATRNGQRVIAVTMGHNSIKNRDKKVAGMMNQGLAKLALNTQMTTPNIYAKVPNDKEDAVEVAAASTAETDQQEQTLENSWSIQVGAFSNYAKARHYAQEIKKEIHRQYAHKQIDIEPIQSGAAVIYRSKLSGFDKDEANKACNRLKKDNKSCIVVANANQELLLANRE